MNHHAEWDSLMTYGRDGTEPGIGVQGENKWLALMKAAMTKEEGAAR